MDDMKTLKRSEDLITREIDKLVDKGSLNPAEMDTLHKAIDSLEKIVKTEKACEELKMMKEHPAMYSGAYHPMHGMSYPHHGVPHTSYGWEAMAHSTCYPAASEYDMYSGVQHRSPTTGRYTSGGYPEEHRMNRDNFSGHSINDRMVDQLERMMDTAKTEFERQQILDKIKMIKGSPDQIR